MTSIPLPTVVSARSTQRPWTVLVRAEPSKSERPRGSEGPSKSNSAIVVSHRRAIFGRCSSSKSSTDGKYACGFDDSAPAKSDPTLRPKSRSYSWTGPKDDLDLPSLDNRLVQARIREGRRTLTPSPSLTLLRQPRQLVGASNRMPVVISANGAVKRGAGGLVTALDPVLREAGGAWVGYPGVDTAGHDVKWALTRKAWDLGYELVPVQLTDEAVGVHYGVVSNEVIWPLLHSMRGQIDADAMGNEAAWDTYLDVNARFADAIAGQVEPGDRVWIHDYHLLFVGQRLQQLGLDNTGLFLHVPFPAPEVLALSGHAEDIVRALLRHRVLGFHTESRDLSNFLACVKRFVPQAQIGEPTSDGTVRIASSDGCACLAGAFPISIDYAAFEQLARQPESVQSAARIRQRTVGEAAGAQLILATGRLDYTKGFDRQLRAFERVLAEHAELHGQVALLLVTVPSRGNLDAYRQYAAEVDSLVERINQRFGTETWQPVAHQADGVPQRELAAYYRAADVHLVTPHPYDGMNLVIKEAIACSEDAALVVSPGAGATIQLRDAGLGDRISVANPERIDDLAACLLAALMTPARERREKMRALQHHGREHDVSHWAASFLSAWDQADGGRDRLVITQMPKSQQILAALPPRPASAPPR